MLFLGVSTNYSHGAGLCEPLSLRINSVISWPSNMRFLCFTLRMFCPTHVFRRSRFALHMWHLSFVLHVSPYACLTVCMFQSKYILLHKCFTLRMFQPTHVLLYACFTQRTFHCTHVSPYACFINKVCWPEDLQRYSIRCRELW